MTHRKVDRLLFIFDADSGVLDAVVDSARKLLRIGGCALCAITHGLATEKGEMRACRDELGVPVDYVHKDEIPDHLRPLCPELPCVIATTGDDDILLLRRETIERCRGSVADLRGKLLFHAAKHDLDLL